MGFRRLAVLVVLSSLGCGDSTPVPTAPSAPSTSAPGTTGVGTSLTLSGSVYAFGVTGRQPLSAALVEFADEASAWGTHGRATTDTFGRFALTLTPRHYRARATKSGYLESSVVELGYLERSRTVDFELTSTSAPAVALSITAVQPALGSNRGETPVLITGTGFRPGTSVSFDGRADSVYVQNSTTIHATTPAHAVGIVDLVVTNPNGEVATLSRAYTFAVPQSFDFNGTWVGYALAHPSAEGRIGGLHSDMELQFTIEHGVLTNLLCGSSVAVPLATPPLIRDGEFSFVDRDITISGHIVSADTAVGAINTALCPATRWSATKR